MKRIRKKQEPLNIRFNDNEDIMEIGIDEAGRGPLFGRVYSAAVILPKQNEKINEEGDTFNYACLKDSKKFSSKKKLIEVAEYIKEYSKGGRVNLRGGGMCKKGMNKKARGANS